mmetsp:Transcript_2986/g.4612  ORF Transcript_2986/g.4612 Transcript_2986/m.4612 type:complete len:360 (+) Transcript_2986:550-1629(+)
MQSVLASIKVAKMMSEENMYWPLMPNEPLNAKGLADWAISMASGTNYSKYSTLARPKQEVNAFIRKSFVLKRDIIISSENLVWLPKTATVELRDSVFKGFNVTVVIAYREWISHALSLYFEKERARAKAGVSVRLFSTFLMHIMDEQPRDETILKSIAGAIDVFGADHVKVIDYDGTLAAGKDVAYALICEIGGVLCDKWHTLPKHESMNIHSSLVIEQLFAAFLHYVHALNIRDHCTFCTARDDQLRKIFHRAYEHSSGHPSVPLIHTSLSLLVPYSNSIDAQFREQFEAITINGNATANREIAQSHVRTSELAVDTIWSSDAWLAWMSQLVDEARRQNALCCGINNLAGTHHSPTVN